MKVVVSQIGARMDYAVPLALHATGSLERLVTDLHLSRPHRVKRLKRYSSGIPEALVARDNKAGLIYRAALATSPRSVWPHLRIAETIAKNAVAAVRESRADVIYGFDTAMLPSLDRLRDDGAMIILEQCIAPRAQFIDSMERLKRRLQERGLAIDLSDLDAEIAVARVFSSLEEAEWQFADRIYCPSAFVASALHELGVSQPTTRLVPYGISMDAGVMRRPLEHGKPRVAFCGRFTWRKGALDFGTLANALKLEARFEALGLVGLPPHIIEAVAPDVFFHGHLNRADYRKTLAEADLMVLPSYSEGSATVVYEAMALGIPCVVSAETGSVITHGDDGMIVPAGDVQKLIEAVSALLDDPQRRNEMGQRAAITAQSYTRENYGRRIVEAISTDFEHFRFARG